MKAVRNALAWVSLALLGGGYLGAMLQAFSPGGNGPSPATVWAEKMDQAPIRFLALALLVAAVILSFVPAKEAEE